MENTKDDLYKDYQKKSDPQILETYFTAVKKSKIKGISKAELSKATNQYTTAKLVIGERKLNLEYYRRLQAIEDQKENNKANFSDYIKSGIKSLIIGFAIFGITLALIYQFEGYNFLFLGLIVGGFKILQGIIELSMGLYIRVAYTKKF